MPATISQYNGSPSKFGLKIEYVEPSDTFAVFFELWNAESDTKIVSLGVEPAGSTTKVYNSVTVADTVNSVKIRVHAVDAAGNVGPASFSEDLVLDRTPPGTVII